VVGSLVWLEDPDEAWIDGEVVEINKEDIKVLCTSGKTVSAFIKTPQCPCLMCPNFNSDLLFTSVLLPCLVGLFLSSAYIPLKFCVSLHEI
jgi:hypothetical protein